MKYLIYFLLWFVPIVGAGQISCKPEVIHFLRQSQLDSFPIIFKGCDYIDSTIFIRNIGIINVDSLYFVKRFNKVSIANTNVENLEGLNGLDSVGSLEIHGNKLLKNLHGLKNLKKAQYINIGNNDSISSLHGLDLDSLYGQLSLSALGESSYNGNLKNLSGLKATFINKLILGNKNLEDLGGSEIGYLKILNISQKNTLKKLVDLDPREIIEIGMSNTISDISALNELLTISDHNLRQLRLVHLPNLQNCAIEYICQNIDKEGFLYLENLGSGCNSIAEIKAACLLNSKHILIDEWAAYPNLCNDYLNISFADEQKGSIKIFDLSGRLVAQQDKTYGSALESFSCSPWQSGLYFIHFITGNGRVGVKKFIKI
jgi:hypothetical protein